MALGHRTYLCVVAPVPSSSPAVREKSRYAQGVSIARVRSDLLEVPTRSLPVILVFQTDERAVWKIEARFLSWPITSCLPVNCYLNEEALTRVNHEGNAYNSNQARQPNPVKQLVQVIRSPARKNTTPITRIP